MVSRESTGSVLRDDLRAFIREHPQGWGHEEWTALLDRLRERGHDVSDPGRVGRELERERLAAMLGSIEKVGPQRIKSILERYETVWSLRSADVEDLAQSTRIPRALAERIKAEV